MQVTRLCPIEPESLTCECQASKRLKIENDQLKQEPATTIASLSRQAASKAARKASQQLTEGNEQPKEGIQHMEENYLEAKRNLRYQTGLLQKKEKKRMALKNGDDTDYDEAAVGEKSKEPDNDEISDESENKEAKLRAAKVEDDERDDDEDESDDDNEGDNKEALRIQAAIVENIKLLKRLKEMEQKKMKNNQKKKGERKRSSAVAPIVQVPRPSSAVAPSVQLNRPSSAVVPRNPVPRPSSAVATSVEVNQPASAVAPSVDVEVAAVPTSEQPLVGTKVSYIVRCNRVDCQRGIMMGSARLCALNVTECQKLIDKHQEIYIRPLQQFELYDKLFDADQNDNPLEFEPIRSRLRQKVAMLVHGTQQWNTFKLVFPNKANKLLTNMRRHWVTKHHGQTYPKDLRPEFHCNEVAIGHAQSNHVANYCFNTFQSDLRKYRKRERDILLDKAWQPDEIAQQYSTWSDEMYSEKKRQER
jgi:hypothetical protein